MSTRVPNRKLVQPVIGPSPIPGCRALFDLRWGVDLISGRFCSSNSATRFTGIGGQAHDFSGGSNLQWAHHPDYAITGPLTVVAFLDVDTLSNYGAIIAKQGATTNNICYEWRVGAAINDSKLQMNRGGAACYGTAYAGTNQFSAGAKQVCIAQRWPSDQCDAGSSVFTNGVEVGLSSTFSGSGSRTITDNGSSSVWVGRRFDTSAVALDGKIYWVALFDRGLDNNEIFNIYANPSIIFPTQPRRSRVGVAGAPPGGFLPAWVRRRSQVIGAGVH